jgi:glycosyltransferase involved in cell wall biosynthesis
MLARSLPDRVVIINDASRVRGGATSIALSNAHALGLRGVPVTFISGDDGPTDQPGEALVDFAAIGSHHLLDGSRMAATLRGVYNIKAERFLSEWIADSDTPRTVYHLHGWSKILSPSIFRSLNRVSSRLVIHAHDFFLTCPNGGYFDFQNHRPCTLKPLSASCLISHCDRRNYAHKLWRSARLEVRRVLLDPSRTRFIAVHDGMLPLLERGGIPRERLTVLRNPIVPWRARRIHAEGNKTFLFIGRLEEDKGISHLAQAARRAGVPLRVVGLGPLGPTLQRGFSEVEFVGWKSHREIAELCADVRAFVMPTRSRETFGLAILEALTSGLPVIVSDHALMAPEIVGLGLGLSCDPNDVEGMAEKLSQLAKDDASVASMSRKAHANAFRLAPTLEQWTDELLKTYAGLLAKGERGDVRTKRWRASHSPAS